jgi:hypothetical protein
MPDRPIKLTHVKCVRPWTDFRQFETRTEAGETGTGMLTRHPAKRAGRIAVLHEEIELIYIADERYWRQANPSNAAKAEYYRRQDRLEEIRSELAKLQKK